jgi:Phytanoyl-CoA dioxygenase (PhyH)
MRVSLFASITHLLRIMYVIQLSKILTSIRPVPPLDDLCEFPDDSLIPPLDRAAVDLAFLTPDQRQWRDEGVVIKRNFIPEPLVDAYCAVRETLRDPGGWRSPTPYMHVPEIRALCLYPPLMNLMKDLVGGDMFMHLNLTGWVTTSRNWHQDDYLNPDFVNGWYCAAWFALDEIHADSGPFEYVPGSHRWPILRQAKVKALLTRAERRIADPTTGAEYWPKLAERVTTKAFETKIARTGSKTIPFLGNKGDVLIWHSRLAHRGSLARDKSRLRKAIISHYSAIGHRPDMPKLDTNETGQSYAHFQQEHI